MFKKILLLTFFLFYCATENSEYDSLVNSLLIKMEDRFNILENINTNNVDVSINQLSINKIQIDSIKSHMKKVPSPNQEDDKELGNTSGSKLNDIQQKIQKALIEIINKPYGFKVIKSLSPLPKK